MRGIHWFRRDLRLRDNLPLRALAERAEEWLPVYVLDPRLVEPAKGTPRLAFLLDCLERLGDELAGAGIPLVVRAGRPEQVIGELLDATRATLLSFGEDVSPFARARDARVREAAERRGARVLSTRDDVIFAAGEVRTGAGGAYRVYTPFRNRWRQRWLEAPRLPARRPRLPRAIPGFSRSPVPTESVRPGTRLPAGGERAAARRLARFLAAPVARYAEDRDRPDRDGTSRLSPYLRFGAISSRACYAAAEEAAAAEPRARTGAGKWQDELVWREFYANVLEENPHVLRRNQRAEFDALDWEDDPAGFAAWCAGRTGFPIVDAGMRQLEATGWMQGRVRMIVASFLTKDLLIDWRRGERYFASRLLDFDPASNSGGWQWAASTGTDPQPYFRIFHPTAQGRRCDPEGRYVRRFVPELRGVPVERIHEPWASMEGPAAYPRPIVDHAERRTMALMRFRRARERKAADG